MNAAERSRNGLGHIQLPQRLPASYSSQLVCNYQPPARRKRTGQEERASHAEEGYQLLLSRVPRVLCFTQHDIVVAVDPTMGVQSHSLVAFVGAPPSLLYPAHEQMAGIWKPEREAAAVTAAGGTYNGNGSADESNGAGRRAKDVRSINRRGAGYLVDTTAPLAPSAAQFVPGSVVSSHLITPMCPHWFLSPTPLPSAVSSAAATPATSSSSAEQKSRALAPHSGSELYHRLVCVPARSARYLFSGGYFDGSLKVHSLLHGRAHIEGEGGMGGGQQSQHVMAALAAKSEDPLNLQRPAVRSQNILDCRPLSSVRQHRAVVSALHLSSNSAILLSGDEDGVVCMWRTYLDRPQEKTRPPIASTALASFAVHEGPVVSLDTNTVIGIAISLAKDEQRTRGCDVCVHSIRGGAARFMHNVVVHDSSVDLHMCALTATANIVLYGLKDGVPTLWLYSLNGSLLCSTPTNEVLSVLQCTPTASRTVNANDGFIVTGGRRGQVVFRQPHNLDMAQTFFADDLFPHSAPHGLPPPPTQLPVAQAVRSASAASASDISAAGDATAPGGSPPLSVTAQSSSSLSAEDWTLVDSRPNDAKQRQEAARERLAANTQQYPPEPLLESIYCDSKLSVTMGIASVDVSRSQKHLVVAVFPDPDLVGLRLMPADHPLAALYSADRSHGGSGSEGRLLLFSLPFSLDPQSFLGFYVDYSAHTLDPLRDSVSAAMFARIADSRDSAIEAVDRARDRLTSGGQQANRKVAEVGRKVFGAINSIFGGKQQTRPAAAQPMPVAAAGGGVGAVGAQQQYASTRGGTANPPVARAVPRHAPNM